MTAPVRRQGKKNINQTFFDESTDWRGKHLKTIERNYKRAKYFEEMFELLLSIYKNKTSLLSEFNIASIDILSDYLGLKTETQISSQMNVREKSSRRLLQIIQKMKGTHYLTGHGARNYLEHELFEKDCIDVEYMEYKCSIYPQLWEREFTQYVSIIDMIAHCGSRSIENMNSETVNWLELIKQN